MKLRILGHPPHTFLVHLPIGVLVASVLWDAVALWRQDPTWWALSFWTLCLGLAAALPALVTGLLDYAALEPGSPAVTTADLHLYTALSAVALFACSALARGGPAPPAGSRLAIALGLSLSGLVLLTAAGWLGGELVLRHRIGTVDDEGQQGAG